MIITFVHNVTWVKQGFDALGILMVNKLLGLEVWLLSRIILHADIEYAPARVIWRLLGYFKCKCASHTIFSGRDNIEAVTALKRSVVDCRPQAWWIDSTLKDLELVPHVWVFRDPATRSVVNVLVLIASLVEISWACDADGLSLSYLLKGNIPAFRYLAVTKLENFWFVIKPHFWVLYLLFITSLVRKIALIIDRNKVVHLAPSLILGLLSLGDGYPMVSIGDRLHIVPHVVIVTEEPDWRRLRRVLFVRQNGLLSSKFIELLFLWLPARRIHNGCWRRGLNVDRLNVVGTRDIREEGGFKDFHFNEEWK